MEYLSGALSLVALIAILIGSIRFVFFQEKPRMYEVEISYQEEAPVKKKKIQIAGKKKDVVRQAKKAASEFQVVRGIKIEKK